jgi:hypothetical protein
MKSARKGNVMSYWSDKSVSMSSASFPACEGWVLNLLTCLGCLRLLLSLMYWDQFSPELKGFFPKSLVITMSFLLKFSTKMITRSFVMTPKRLKETMKSFDRFSALLRKPPALV